ncbi:uncharacterized protein ATNIH1004_002826 [Aspergillus tanneri]|uniref:Uncharacterized protein n=1 Tax=Aspergillus tanneri TaxID=1220188 RepID=A0A5M9MSV2_9EURO|nr:uncharacterized protein ATNIH1004_002826 [Aspergillus tanneri]KAA8650145.1 hypothetical protein ATNIH1004_002826 [Aspergillus tanneri]
MTSILDERFLPLSSIDLSNFHPPDSKRCIAYLDGGNRCERSITTSDLETASKIQLEYDGNSDDKRDDNLTELAKLYRCSEPGHNRDDNVRTAVQQWMLTEQPTVSEVDPPSHHILRLRLPRTDAIAGEERAFLLGTHAIKALSDTTYIDCKLREVLKNPLQSTTNGKHNHCLRCTRFLANPTQRKGIRSAPMPQVLPGPETAPLHPSSKPCLCGKARLV